MNRKSLTALLGQNQTPAAIRKTLILILAVFNAALLIHDLLLTTHG